MKEDLINVAEDSARGSFFLLSGTALSTIIMAIASILIARLLGPELYGQYSLALIVPQLLLLFADLGVNHGIIKFTASLRANGETSEITKVIKYGLMLKILIGATIFIMNYAFADFFASIILNRPELAFYVRIMSISIIFQVILTTVTSAFIGLDKTEFNALTTNIHAVAKAIVSIAMVLVGFGVAGALVGQVLSYVVAAGTGALILFFLLRQRQDPKGKHAPTTDLKILIRYGAPIYVSLLLTGCIPLYQNALLAMFTPDVDIGNYKAAANFATLITVFSVPIATALLPAFSKLGSSTTEKIRTFFRLATKYTTMIILPIIVLIVMFSGEIVKIIYGTTYQSAPLFLTINSLLYLLVGLGYLTFYSFYNGLGETNTTLRIGLVTFVAVAILSPILTKIYGVIGSIVALLVANTLSTVYGMYVSRVKFRITFDTKSTVKIYLISILSSIPPLVLLQFSRLPQLFNVATGALLYLLTYATLVPAARIVDHSELSSAASVLQKVKPVAPVARLLVKYERKILDLQKTRVP